MDRSADQWDGRTAGRPRGTANGRLQRAGLRGPTFINERVCVYGAETARVVTLMSVPHPGSSSIGGVWACLVEPPKPGGFGLSAGATSRSPPLAPSQEGGGQASAHDAGGGLSTSGDL